MATTAVQVRAAVLAVSAVTLETVPASTVSQLLLLHFCNTTNAEITMDAWIRNAGDTTSYYIADDLPVPAKGVLRIPGVHSLSEESSTLRVQASAVGVDVTGTILRIA